MAKVLAIDPGNEESAYVEYDSSNGKVMQKMKLSNKKLLEYIESFRWANWTMAIEMPACYGMAVGQTVFDTCRWVGIFQHAFHAPAGSPAFLVYRKSQNKEHGIDSVTMHLCKSTRAKDTNVRRAILDRYPATGGGATPQVGTKGKPGPLYGVSKDVWSALAVAITFAETYNES